MVWRKTNLRNPTIKHIYNPKLGHLSSPSFNNLMSKIGIIKCNRDRKFEGCS